MNNKFKKALDIIRKTGDKIILFEDINNSENGYLVMNLEEYEKIALRGAELKSLTEEELIDKINRDIAVWKSQQDFDEEEDVNNAESFNFSNDSATERARSGFQKVSRDEQGDKRWKIPEERKEAAEEVIEEDRQYFEEITF